MKRLALLMTVVGVVALYTVGCDSSQELKFLQEKNQTLTQRVAELEGQLKQAEAIVPTTRIDTQSSTAESIYMVVEGDSLWNIAEEQLGDGNRYTEILALNPQIEEDEPLFVGTKLKMPLQ